MRFTVPGPPVPKARPRTITDSRGRTRTYTPARTQAYEQAVALCAQAAGPEPELWEALLEVRMIFYMPTKRATDTDNLIKSVLDAGNGIIYRDDKQVHRVEAEKRYDKHNPRTEVEVTKLETILG